jgi:hypothetical protein
MQVRGPGAACDATSSIVTGVDALLCELRGMGITAHCYLVLGYPTASALVLPQHKYSKTTTIKTLYLVIIDVCPRCCMYAACNSKLWLSM